MEIKLDVWTRQIGKDKKTYTNLHHEKFSEEEILEILKQHLKGRYYEPFDIEIAEVISR